MALARKLLLKPGHRVRVVNPPDGFTLALPEGARHVNEGPADAALGFCWTAADVEPTLMTLLDVLPEDGLLWIGYPKKSSGKQTDLTQMSGWEPVFARGLLLVALVSVDETWTAARFRPADRVKRTTRIAP